MEQEEVEGTGDVVHVRVHPDEDVHRNHFNKSEKYIKQEDVHRNHFNKSEKYIKQEDVHRNHFNKSEKHIKQLKLNEIKKNIGI